jgi:Rrf2 family protein
MKLSTRAIYSLRLMIYLADHAGRNTPISLKEISQEQNLPFRYLEQLVVALKTAGLVKSVQGKQGGYILGREAQDIKALDVVEASMGHVELLKCLEPDAPCTFRDVCTSRRMWGMIQTRITDILAEYSLKDLSETDMKARLEQTLLGGVETGAAMICDCRSESS